MKTGDLLKIWLKGAVCLLEVLPKILMTQVWPVLIISERRFGLVHVKDAVLVVSQLLGLLSLKCADNSSEIVSKVLSIFIYGKLTG